MLFPLLIQFLLHYLHYLRHEASQHFREMETNKNKQTSRAANGQKRGGLPPVSRARNPLTAALSAPISSVAEGRDLIRPSPLIN